MTTTSGNEVSQWPHSAHTWPADEYMAWSHGVPDKHAALRQLAETQPDHTEEIRRALDGEEVER
ncbi:MAG: hypothetical protein ACRDMV_19575 [Streptosporangiales bacterium]